MAQDTAACLVGIHSPMVDKKDSKTHKKTSHSNQRHRRRCSHVPTTSVSVCNRRDNFHKYRLRLLTSSLHPKAAKMAVSSSSFSSSSTKAPVDKLALSASYPTVRKMEEVSGSEASPRERPLLPQSYTTGSSVDGSNGSSVETSIGSPEGDKLGESLGIVLVPAPGLILGGVLLEIGSSVGDVLGKSLGIALGPTVGFALGGAVEEVGFLVGGKTGSLVG